MAAGRPAGRPPRHRGITTAQRGRALIDTPGVSVSANAFSVAGQADDVVLVASHRVSLSHSRDVRALWGRITPGPKSGAGIGNVAIDPEQRA